MKKLKLKEVTLSFPEPHRYPSIHGFLLSTYYMPVTVLGDMAAVTILTFMSLTMYQCIEELGFEPISVSLCGLHSFTRYAAP